MRRDVGAPRGCSPGLICHYSGAICGADDPRVIFKLSSCEFGIRPDQIEISILFLFLADSAAEYDEVDVEETFEVR